VKINGTKAAGSETRAGIGVFDGETSENKQWFWDIPTVWLMKGEAELFSNSLVYVTDTGKKLAESPSNWHNVTLILNTDLTGQFYYNNSYIGSYNNTKNTWTQEGFIITARDTTEYLYDFFYAYNCSTGFPFIRQSDPIPPPDPKFIIGFWNNNFFKLFLIVLLILFYYILIKLRKNKKN